MSATVRRFGAAALAGLALLAVAAPSAHAQRRPFIVRPGPLPVVRPYPVVRPMFLPARVNAYASPALFARRAVPGIPYIGYAYRTAVLRQALYAIPPYYSYYYWGYDPYLAQAALAANPYLGTAALAAYDYGVSPGMYGYGGYDGYYGYLDPYLYAANPYYGYLRGAADVTTANAQYQLIIQQARLERERANQEHLVTRRRIIEEAEWERGRIPNPEKVREADIEAALNRARRDPPLTEVWSARSLNALLHQLEAEQGRGAKGPNIPLDEETLKSINLTPAGSRANAGLLKDDGKLQWPRSLQDQEFTAARTRLSRLLEEAVQKLKFNPNTAVPAGLVRDMQNDLAALNQRLDDRLNDLSPSQFIEARRYLNQVGDAVAALSDPKVGTYLNQSWAGKARNVAELVNYLARSGLRFAPATPGDEPAYTALYRALADFDAGLRELATASPPPSSPRE